MAWQLVAEVLNHAPRELTAGERLVLVAIAEEVHQDRLSSRQCTCTAETLQRLTGMHKRSVTDALRRLEEVRGLRVRIPRRFSDGRPVYAYSGSTSRYRVPKLPPPAGCTCRSCKGESDAHPSIHKGEPDAHPSRAKKGESPTPEGCVSDSTKGESNTHLYREPGLTGGARDTPRGASRCGRHDADPDRDCRECGRLRKAEEAAEVTKPRLLVPPICGHCEGREDGPWSERFVTGTLQLCPDCHPRARRRHTEGATA